jgi:hypothetical protein
MMSKNGSTAYKYLGMNVSVEKLNGNGKIFTYDLKEHNEKRTMFYSFLLDKIMVVVDSSSGKAKMTETRMGDIGQHIYPTGALKKIVKHLGVNGAEKLAFEKSDQMSTLENAGFPKGADIDLKAWKRWLPSTESLLQTVDDSHG